MRRSVAGGGASLLRPRQRRWPAIVCFVVGAEVLLAITIAVFAPARDPNPSLAGFKLADRTIDLPNPAEPGPYQVDTFTYGSGHDLHRPEYAAGARFRTQSVDGSKIDTHWNGFTGWLRTRYWGFDAKAFPIQGRVWAPRGAGPFPLVLMVHGNDWMENPSDTGYAYLGQLLASQGFIFVSVDENFLNNSIAGLGRWGAENNARAWLLLENLAQWRDWDRDPTSPLFGRVDLQRLALMGHSRGGEAVATANAFNQLDRYPDDATQPFDFHFNLRGIVGIAPADGQYKPRGQPTPMRDTNYFVIEGSMDGDVSTFMGSSQYERAAFTPGGPAFKASLYVKDADHTQFNTAWGYNDMGYGPFEFLLDERPLLSGDAQRRIAQVYIAAFLQAALNGKDGYRALLQDPRAGARWLPGGYMVANYADGRTAWLTDFDHSLDPAAGASPAWKIEGHGLAVWKQELGQLKGASLDKVITVLAWNNGASGDAPSYRIDLGSAPPAVESGTELVFSASDAGAQRLPASDNARLAQPGPLDWTVVLKDAAGHSARLPLSQDQLLYPQIKGNTRRLAAINSTAPSEIVLRRYSFPLRDFAAQNPALDLAHLRSIGFEFDRSPRGAIALEDIGLALPWAAQR